MAYLVVLVSLSVNKCFVSALVDLGIWSLSFLFLSIADPVMVKALDNYPVSESPITALIVMSAKQSMISYNHVLYIAKMFNYSGFIYFRSKC